MKKNIFCLTLMALTFSLNAQEQSFKNFKIERARNGDYWIYPVNFAQIFEPMKQELLADDYCELYNPPQGMIKIQPTDSLVKWIDKAGTGEFLLFTKKESVPLDEQWEYLDSGGKLAEVGAEFNTCIQTIPKSLTERLEKHKELCPHIDCIYFRIYAMVNNKGEVLSAYFKVRRDCLDLVREEELQAVYNNALNTHIDAEKFLFYHYPEKQHDEAWAELVKKENGYVSSEKRFNWLMEMRYQGVPCVYGMVKFFEMGHKS